MNHPDFYPRRILLLVTGMTPQVVTETLYGLIHGQSCENVPTEIHLLTTEEGARRAEITLLDEKIGQFFTFCRDFGLDRDSIHFGPETIHRIHDLRHQPLSDIRSVEENRQAGDAITALVREFTSDPDSALHASIAGGRKTMGFYLGYALSLFGREQDRLSHVLVSPDFESLPDFYYPPPVPQVLYNRDGKPLRTDVAFVTMALVPFVRLRDGLTSAILERGCSFSEAVESAQRMLGRATLEVELPANTIRCGGVTMLFSPQQHAVYLWLTERLLQQEEPFVPGRHAYDRLFDWYARVTGPQNRMRVESLIKRLNDDASRYQFMQESRTRINKRLMDRLGGLGQTRYGIHAIGERPCTGYGLRLTPENVTWVNADDFTTPPLKSMP